MKPSLSLSADDLAWLGRALEDDLSGLIGYENLTVTQPDGDDEAVRRAVLTTAPVWEPDRKLLVLPLIWDGRVTALAKFSGLLNLDRLRTTHSPYLARLAQLTLRNFQLTRSVVIDPVTNLFRRVKLIKELGQQIGATATSLESGASRLKSSEEESLRPTVALVVVRVMEVQKLAREHGRQFLVNVQRSIAHSMAEVMGPVNCPARLDEAVFGWLEPGLNAEQARLRAEKWAARLKAVNHEGIGPVPLRLIGGVAAFPEDLNGSWNLGAEGLLEDLALEMEDLAGRALAQSLRRCGGIISLADVRRRCGAVTEILPLGRVVIDLGRAVGVEEGMRYYVAHHSETVSDVYKAELALLNVNAESATGEIVALEDEKFPVAVGDKVNLVEQKGSLRVRAADEKVIELAGEEIKVLVDQTTGLPNPRALPAMVQALAKDQANLALLVIRINGLVSRRSLVGQQEADRLLIRAAEIAQESCPQASAARAGVESVALLLPGTEGQAGMEAGWGIVKKIEEELEQPVSIGVAAHPFGQTPETEIIDRAFKALDHASFPQAEEVVLFNSVSLNVSGDRLYQRGDVEGAVAEYERALALDKDNINVLNSLGVCYGQLNRLPKAADCFERAAKLADDDFMTWYNLGFAQRELGRLEEAAKSLSRANELNGSDFSVLYSLGRVALDQGRMAKAAGWLEQAAQAEGAKPGVHRWLGEALARIDKPDEAMSSFKAAVKADPGDAASLSWLGRLYQERRRDRDVALSLLQQAVELEPENQLYRERLAHALLESDRPGRAVEEFSLALELGGRSASLVSGLALSLAGQGQLNEAIEAQEEAVELAPDDESIKDVLDRLKDRRSDEKEQAAESGRDEPSQEKQ